MFCDYGKVLSSRLFIFFVFVQGELEVGLIVFFIIFVEKCVGDDYEKMRKVMLFGQCFIVGQQLVEVCDIIVVMIVEVQIVKMVRDIRVKVVVVCVIVVVGIFLKKLSLFIKGIMDLVKSEENQQFQG